MQFTLPTHPGRFEYTGTRDYTAFATLPAALQFVDQTLGGLQAMRDYNTALLHEGSELVRRKWNSFFVVRASPGCARISPSVTAKPYL